MLRLSEQIGVCLASEKDTYDLPHRMENQVISKRYVKKQDLHELLGRLFGSSYFLEVGHQRVLLLSSLS